MRRSRTPRRRKISRFRSALYRRASNARSGTRCATARISGRRSTKSSRARSPGSTPWCRTHRWELIFLTSRPETRGDTAQAQSHRWLSKHGYLQPSVFVVHGSRGKIAASLALDVIVDDRPENCLDVAIDSSARAILVWRGDADNVPGSARQLGIGSVRFDG